MSEMPFDTKLKIRKDGLREFLKKDHPEIFDEQKHLDDGTPERTYWHYGYYVALGDVLNLMDKTINLPEN